MGNHEATHPVGRRWAASDFVANVFPPLAQKVSRLGNYFRQNWMPGQLLNRHGTRPSGESESALPR